MNASKIAVGFIAFAMIISLLIFIAYSIYKLATYETEYKYTVELKHKKQFIHPAEIEFVTVDGNSITPTSANTSSMRGDASRSIEQSYDGKMDTWFHTKNNDDEYIILEYDSTSPLKQFVIRNRPVVENITAESTNKRMNGLVINIISESGTDSFVVDNKDKIINDVTFNAETKTWLIK